MRIVADLHFLCRADDFLIDTEPDLREKVRTQVLKYKVADQIELEDVTETTVAIGVEGPTAEEVDKARQYLKGTFAIGHQAPEAMADVLGEIAFYGLPRDYYDTWLDKIAAVTVGDVKRVASRFPLDDSVLLVLGAADTIRKDLDSLGTVSVAPLSQH